MWVPAPLFLQLVPIYYSPICSWSRVCDSEFSVPAGLLPAAGKNGDDVKKIQVFFYEGD